MKLNRLLVFILCLTAFSGLSQNIDRIEVHGKIVVENVDVEGVTVYNSSSNMGTITDVEGQFSIEVALNDRLEVSALQFEKFVVVIDRNIINSKLLTVFLVERVNRLDEVVILPYGLSGNLAVDLESVKTFNPDMDALYFGIQNMDEYEFSADYKTAVINTAMEDGRYYNMADAAQIMDLLIKPLFKSSKDTDTVRELSPYESLTTKFSLTYLMKNLEIPENNISEFINFVEEGEFDRNLMNEGNEVQFLEYLVVQSKNFKKSRANKK